MQTSRRTVLTAAASCALAGVAGADSSAESGSDLSRESYQILEGTDHETTVYQTVANADGPTVLVIGGVHGDEVSGYEVASAIAEWEIDAGTLVTIPHANAEAVEQRTRTGDDGIDLNRQFSEGEEPTTNLAQELWNVVDDHDPDVVIDLHESIGIYVGGPVDGVGQAVFHSDSTETATDAEQAAEAVNRNHVDEPGLEFTTDTFAKPENEPSGLLVHKASRELNAQSFLIETLSRGPDLETRTHWHTRLVTNLIEEELLETETTDDSTGETTDDSEDSTGNTADDSDNSTGDTTDDSDNSTGGTTDDSDDEPVIEQCRADAS